VKPFDEFAMLSPSDPDGTSAALAEHAGVPVAIVDANNINVEVLGTSPGFPVDRKTVREVLLDNPLGQNDELTLRPRYRKGDHPPGTCGHLCGGLAIRYAVAP
jgi:hypothetical protein